MVDGSGTTGSSFERMEDEDSLNPLDESLPDVSGSTLFFQPEKTSIVRFGDGRSHT